MRRLALVALILALSGCAFFKGKAADINACWSDPACKAAAIEKSESAKDTAETIAGLSPVPAAGPIVGSIAGYSALVLALLAGGAVLNKKKEESPK